MEEIRISGKDLGAVALPDFCPRCFWIQRRAPDGIPYQIFPGIFSSIDSYSKHVVHSWFDRHKSAPTWLAGLGDVVGYTSPPHFSKFNFIDSNTGIRLTGAPDALFNFRDGTILIGDYKTAKFTATQDSLLPMYQTQLNAYALIAKQIGIGPVSKLALIYTEPITDRENANTDDVHYPDGFRLAFSAHILPIVMNMDSIPQLLMRTKEIVAANTPPSGRPGCKNCEKLNGINGLLMAKS